MEEEDYEDTLDGFTMEDGKILQINIHDNFHEEEGGLHKDTKKVTTTTKQNPKNIMPKEYHDYLLVFEEREKLIQPLHQHHDHQIPLIDNQVLPFEPLCTLDETRLQTLQEYLDSSVKRGWIQSSTSLAGAPI
jgi:hypothetical protein